MEKLTLTNTDIQEFGVMAKKMKIFVAMNIAIVEKILNRITLYKYSKGEIICRQGGEGDSFFVVREGKLRVSTREGFFFSRTLAHLSPGDCFGEMALLNHVPRNVTVSCMEDSKIFVLMADTFDQMLAENPAFSDEIKRISTERSFELKSH